MRAIIEVRNLSGKITKQYEREVETPWELEDNPPDEFEVLGRRYENGGVLIIEVRHRN